MIDFNGIPGLLSFLIIVFTANAQNSAGQPSQFDLVIFGSNIDSNTEVMLKENPGTENSWQKLDSGTLITDEESEFSSFFFNNLSVEKFAGQDIRENYIAIKINPSAGSEQHIRGLYALPHVDHSPNTQQKIHATIRSYPEQIRKYSLGKLIFPRAQSVSGDNIFTEHIEMPVRHLKPGIQEVKWLDIIFSED